MAWRIRIKRHPVFWGWLRSAFSRGVARGGSHGCDGGEGIAGQGGERGGGGFG